MRPLRVQKKEIGQEVTDMNIVLALMLLPLPMVIGYRVMGKLDHFLDHIRHV